MRTVLIFTQKHLLVETQWCACWNTTEYCCLFSQRSLPTFLKPLAPHAKSLLSDRWATEEVIFSITVAKELGKKYINALLCLMYLLIAHKRSLLRKMHTHIYTSVLNTLANIFTDENEYSKECCYKYKLTTIQTPHILRQKKNYFRWLTAFLENILCYLM